MRYFVLRTTGKPDEVARWQRHGGASYYDPAVGGWVPDPLLAAELSIGDEWRQVDPALLPRELVVDDSPSPRPRSGRRSAGRRSRGGGLRRRLRRIRQR